uniref:hypothetical protein n=1 Tax=Ruminococcus sp. TaxID=41978 RepID=UPI003AF73BAD
AVLFYLSHSLTLSFFFIIFSWVDCVKFYYTTSVKWLTKKFFWGFDIGTDSVGWAVSNSEYKLKKYKNNLMWGVHLFDEAKQSAERRLFRTARRRLDRRKQRIILLQEFFC